MQIFVRIRIQFMIGKKRKEKKERRKKRMNDSLGIPVTTRDSSIKLHTRRYPFTFSRIFALEREESFVFMYISLLQKGLKKKFIIRLYSIIIVLFLIIVCEDTSCNLFRILPYICISIVYLPIDFTFVNEINQIPLTRRRSIQNSSSLHPRNQTIVLD